MKVFKRTESVDQVVADFNKTVQRLEAIETAKIQDSADKAAEVTRLNLQIKENNEEASRARKVADKIKALLS